MDRKAELREMMSPMMTELRAIEESERQSELMEYVGKYFKFRNSYSCPNGEEDKWWLYKKVTAEGDDLTVLNFQRDVHGRIDISHERLFCKLSGVIEISREEFVAAWETILKEINSFNP